MLSLQTIRERTDEVRAACAQRGTDAPVDRIVELDDERRPLLGEVEAMRADRNRASKAIGAAKDADERQRLIEEQRSVSSNLDALEERLRAVDEELNGLLLEVPNLFHADVPIGGEDENAVIIHGDPATGFEERLATPVPRSQWPDPEPDASLKPHWDLGEALGIIDFERGVKLSGANFYLLKGDGARLQRALISWMLDLHRAQGYTEIYPPVLVNEAALVGTGQLPKFADTMFQTTDGRWLIPTSEVPVTNMYAGEILEPGTLPIHHTAYSPCFRREQFSAGSAVRGIKRGYQFDKVEMVRFEEPDRSWDALEELLEHALETVRTLGLRYRVLRLASQDLTFASAMTYDIDVWAPGAGEWLEVSSISNFLDFQARRANLRYRTADGSVAHLHTLNGSGLGMPRTVAAVLEQHQLEDGSVELPAALRPYLGGQTSIEA
ncbi:MAG: serine--tRNA ligase [Chloroflexi bacterium]|nr:serine--tRNA ligase [Chloroflexota bacterium]MDA1148208.1 serine--tRNA ligase [Chloroflexota bacterium]